MLERMMKLQACAREWKRTEGPSINVHDGYVYPDSRHLLFRLTPREGEKLKLKRNSGVTSYQR
jgi:hypothetical protein